MNKLIMTAALAAAVLAANVSLADPVTYYLSATETGFNHACVDASKWKDANGNAAGAAGDPLTADDIYVIRNGRVIRTIAESKTTPTIFMCKRLVLGEVGSKQAGGINSYAGDESVDKVTAYIDFGSGATQDGVYFVNGKYLARADQNYQHHLHFKGKMTVASLENAPYVITPYSARYPSLTLVDGESWIKSDIGTALVLGGSHDGKSSSSTSLSIYFYADVSQYFGKLIVAPCCASHTASPSYVSTIYLKDGVFPGTLELRGGARLQPQNAQSVVQLANAVFNDDSALVLPVANVEGEGGVAHMQSARVVVTNDLTVSGTVKVILSPIPANGETNRLALVTGRKGSFAESNFALALPSDMAVHDWYLRDGMRLSIVTNDETNTQTLYAELQPLVKLSVTDKNDKTTPQSSALDSASSWSDGKLPHPNAHYIIPGSTCLNTKPGNYEFPGDSLTVESGGYIMAWNNDSVLKIPVLRMLSGSTLNCGQGMRVDFADTHLIAGSGTVTLMAFGGEAFNARMKFLESTTITGAADLSMNSILTSVPRGNYYFLGDNSGFKGRMSLRQTAAAEYGSKFETLWVSRAEDLGGPLDEFDAAALYLSNYGRLSASANVVVPKSNNRGLTVSGNGVIDPGAYTLSLGMPLTINGTLYKANSGTLQLDADRAAVGANGGNIVVTNGMLAIAAADAVNGFAVHLAPNAALSLKVDLENENLTRYGLRNVGLAEPFVLGAGVTALPLSVDVSNAALPKHGGTIGVLTVSDSATNAIEQVFSVPKSYRGFKFTRLKLHDDENGWTTYAAKYEPIGIVISVW